MDIIECSKSFDAASPIAYTSSSVASTSSLNNDLFFLFVFPFHLPQDQVLTPG
nr:hypothetical protein [Clostridium tetani]